MAEKLETQIGENWGLRVLSQTHYEIKKGGPGVQQEKFPGKKTPINLLTRIKDTKRRKFSLTNFFRVSVESSLPNTSGTRQGQRKDACRTYNYEEEWKHRHYSATR